jgi:beta-phosphoglucomutase-like phosphatase (HAD superfamily)
VDVCSATAADLVADREHVLLDFDGPVCEVYPPNAARAVAQRLRAYLGRDLPAHIAASQDPLVLLRCAWLVSETAGQLIELELRTQELLAIRRATETPGTLDMVKTLVLRGHTVTIVSDISSDAVGAYLSRHEIGKYIHEISARHSFEQTPLMPDPFLINQAVYLLHATPNRCCLIGDSTTTVQAAHAADVPAIACVELTTVDM